jgi:hypothetical protein
MALFLVAYTYPVLLPLIAVGHVVLRTASEPPPYGIREGVTWWIGGYSVWKATTLLSTSTLLLLSTGSLLQSCLALAPLGTLIALFRLWGKRRLGLWLLALFELPSIAYFLFLSVTLADLQVLKTLLVISAPFAITSIWYWRRRSDA